MQFQGLIQHLSSFQKLNETEINSLLAFVKERKIKRRQFLLTEGEICKQYTFIIEGCFKMYKIDNKGQEHNLQFSIENEWISDIGSFHDNTPSGLYIEALEKGTILQIEKNDLLYLYTHFPKFDRYFRVLVENAFINLQKRVLQNISDTAEERYLKFTEENPALLNRISNVQIASYIGITPEFLSKIRKNILHK
ncbi:Crp/Fnr family transcriptional regulator [Flavicella sediminum]|uniref:Crp/Fnr family transcriptional regulator n=1 Tax=Flavicella sediminum TaxID=2585141 RepID=UPI00111E4804|nr:Crp/Fnr family transcriptional regulator [Flavicella sediminum]